MKTITRLHAGNSSEYRARSQSKRAVIRWESAKYSQDWGDQSFDGPHVVVKDGDTEYGVDLQVFFETHQPCPDQPDAYQKTAKVRAVRVTEPTKIETWVRGRLEGTAEVQAGGWVVQNPKGEIYNNTAEEFAKRYEPIPTDRAAVRMTSPTLDDHFFGDGPKRILSLDGGGIRGRITLGILKQIEAQVGAPLSDYFDLIGGTSTGSIIAAGLALGWNVDRLISLYDELGSSVFDRSLFRYGIWWAKFASAPLEEALEAHFGDIRLGSNSLKTGLAIVAKRLDSNSPWPFHNHPRGRYYGDPPSGKNWTPNKNYLLRQLVRASVAAPSYFDPELIRITVNEEGAFVDGGVSPHNNPTLQLVLMATLHGCVFRWPLGLDRLSVVSVGTGTWRTKHSAQKLLDNSAAANAALSLMSLMDDCSALNRLLLQWFSDSKTPEQIDSEVRDLAGEVLGGGDPWLSYVRYDARLEVDWLAAHLPEEPFDEARLASLRKMDNPRSLELLAKIGDAAGQAVDAEHFRV
jgi:hypothetical protein